ncbi:hypothetical protein J4E89_002910 [Alternaria sp. Ai002NY15]|nr:hypothetical protein J4E89_002910 [Alternaria sp. Ai002NY15]
MAAHDPEKWSLIPPSQIKADLEQCSGQLLAPLLSEIHASLPLEVRENIYEHVFDISKPIVIPRLEHPNVEIVNGRLQSGSAGASEHAKAMHEELSPFKQDYCFSVAVMGSPTSAEFQNLALRKTPFYFRGSRTSLNVRHLLNTEIRPGVYFRDLVRHLRVYLRSNAAFHEAEDIAAGADRAQLASYSEYVTLDVPSTCAMYLDRLEGLETLNYTNHTVMLELCFLAPATGPGGILHEPSTKRNLYEMVGSVYRRARDGGADVKVRYERFSTGGGEDWTEYLETDRRDAVQLVRTTTTRVLRRPISSLLAPRSVQRTDPGL